MLAAVVAGGECVCSGEAVERQSRSLLVIMASRNNPVQRQCWADALRRTSAEEKEKRGKKRDKLGS